MTGFPCSSYAVLARRLMLIYRRTPAGEVLRTSAGLSSTESEIEEIHREMAQHRATCELCKTVIRECLRKGEKVKLPRTLEIEEAHRIGGPGND